MQIEITPEYLASQGLSKTFCERFWKKVNKTESCWLWKASTSSGYGAICRGVHEGYVRGHVASWIIHKGPVPKGMCVCHNCPNGDNRLCVNPEHLWLGTAIQNTADAWNKGRIKKPPIKKTKIPKKIQNEIISLYKKGVFGTRSVAKKFGVHRNSIITILKNNHHWPGVAGG